MDTTGFQQVKIDNNGTYGAYNPQTSQAVAFPDQNTLNQFFGGQTALNPNAPAANFDVSGLLGSNAGQVKAVSLNSLTPATPLNVPQATPQPDNLAPAVASATQISKTLNDYIKELTPPPTETFKAVDQGIAEVNSLLPSVTGRGQAQLSAEQQAGIPDLKKQLSDLNAQILSKTAEANLVSQRYDQLSTSLENQSIPTNLVFGQQAQVKKMQLAESNARASELGLLQARALGLQGQVQASQEAVNRAIDLRYQDAQDTLDLKLKQLELLQGKLAKEEAITAKALERKYQDEQQKIAEEKAKAKENISLAFQANVKTTFVNKGGEIFRVSDGKSYSTPVEFFRDAGITSFEQAYQKGLITDINGETLSNLQFVQQARNKYGDVNIPVNATPEEVARIIQGSKIYQKDVYIPGNYELRDDGTIFNKNTGQIVQGINQGSPITDGSAVAIKDSFNAIATRLSKDGRVSAQTVLNQYLQRGDMEGAKQFVISTAISALPVEQQNKAFGRLTALDALKDIQVALNDYSNAGGDTGVLKGNYEKIIQKLGNTSNPRLADIANRISLSMIAYRNAVSGAAFTESEAKQYESIFPSIKGETQLNNAKIDSILHVFNLNQRSALTTVLGQRNYDDLMVTSPTLGQIVEYNGRAYQVDSNGDMTPIGTGSPLDLDKARSSGGLDFGPTAMRTDRHNNPTAFTTTIAKQAGLVLGKDYIVGDPFPNNPNLRTAKLLGDPIAQTIKVIDRIGFKTSSGGNRWTYTDSIPGTKNWKNLSYEQKKKVIAQMYQHEGGKELRQYFA